MPVVIKRTATGGSGKKPDSAKSTKPPAAKGKAKKASAGGWSDIDPKTKMIGLSAVIVISVLAVLWMTGVLSFGSSAPPPNTPQTVVSTPGTGSTPAATVGQRPGASPNAPAGVVQQPGAGTELGEDTRKTGALPGGEGIP